MDCKNDLILILHNILLSNNFERTLVLVLKNEKGFKSKVLRKFLQIIVFLFQFQYLQTVTERSPKRHILFSFFFALKVVLITQTKEQKIKFRYATTKLSVYLQRKQATELFRESNIFNLR